MASYFFLVVLFLFVVFLSDVTEGKTDEQQCYSRYDFEEKLLEKSIRTEMLMETYNEKLQKGLVTLAAHIEEFEVTKVKLDDVSKNVTSVIDSQLAAMEQKFSDMKEAFLHDIGEEIVELERKHDYVQREIERHYVTMQETFNKYTQLHDFTERALQRTQDEADAQLVTMKESLSDWRQEASSSVPTIAFNVNTAVDKTPNQNVVKFQNILLNAGDAYDESSGKFTAPINGTYLFGAQVCPEQKKLGMWHIAVDDLENVILVIADYNENSPFSSSSGTVVVVLVEGQTVFVRNWHSYVELRDSSNACYNQFMGVLVHL